MQASKLRFSAAHLFYVVSLTAAAVGLLGWLGLPAAGFIVLVWLQILAGAERESQAVAHAVDQGSTADFQPQGPMPLAVLVENHTAPSYRASRLDRGGVSKVELLVVMIISTLLVGLLVPANSESDPLLHAETSMKMVAKAVQAYEQQYGRLPPVVYADDGTPLHSWRALILPFMGEEKLAASYRLDEPWNSPSNLQLSQYRPWHYQIYYPGEKPHSTRTSLHILRDASDCLHVVEHEAAIDNWLKPVEFGEFASQTISWQDFGTVPAVDQGFWERGFFVSSYRGRLAVGSDSSHQLHPEYWTQPNQNLTVDGSTPILSRPQLTPSLSNSLPSAQQRLVLGETYRQWHFGNALRLSFFLFLALYPYRWLKQIQS